MRTILLVISLIIIENSLSQVKVVETVAKDSRTSLKKIPKKHNFINFEQIGDYYYGIYSKSQYEFYLFLWQPIKYPVKYDFVIVKYDKDFNLVELKTIKSSIEYKTKINADVKRVGNELCAFYYFNNLKTNKQYLFAQKIDIEKLEVTGSAIKIAETTIDSKTIHEPNYFVFKLSQDYSKLLVSLNFEVNYKRQFLTSKVKRKKRSSIYWLYDSELNILDYRKDLNISKSSGSTLVDYQVDNKGNVILLGFEYDKSKDFKKKINSLDIAFQNLIFSARIITLEGKDQTIKMGNGSLMLDGKLIYNFTNNLLAFIGLKASKDPGSKGVIVQHFTIDSFNLIRENEFDFDSELIRKIETSLKKNKKVNKKTVEEDLDTYIRYLSRIGDCFFNQDNELYISTQKYYFTTTQVDKKNSSAEVTSVCHSDIIAFKFDSLCSFESYCAIPYFVANESTTNVNFDAIYKNGEFYIFTNTNYSKIDFNSHKSKVKSLKIHLINYSLKYKYKFGTSCIVIIYPVKKSSRYFTRYELN